MTLTDEAASYAMDAQTLQALRNMGNECEAAADEIQRLRADRDTEEACARLHAGLLREVSLAMGNALGDDRSTLPERVRAMRDDLDRLRAALQEADTLLCHEDNATEWRERWAGLWAKPGDLLYGGDAVARALAAKNEAETNALKAAQEADELRASLKAVLSHWREFGPEHGFDECVERAAAWALGPNVEFSGGAPLYGAASAATQG